MCYHILKIQIFKERKMYNDKSRLIFPISRKNYNLLDSLKPVVDNEDQRLHRLVFVQTCQSTFNTGPLNIPWNGRRY